ncbi:MAG: hypothetical protein ACJAUG_000071 [Halioglobus sp.]|jgi:hypothetical protein
MQENPVKVLKSEVAFERRQVFNRGTYRCIRGAGLSNLCRMLVKTLAMERS